MKKLLSIFAILLISSSAIAQFNCNQIKTDQLTITCSGSNKLQADTVIKMATKYMLSLKLSWSDTVSTVATKYYVLNALSGYQPTLTTGNLTANAPASFSATRQVIGGAAALTLDTSTAAGGLATRYDISLRPTGTGVTDQVVLWSGTSTQTSTSDFSKSTTAFVMNVTNSITIGASGVSRAAWLGKLTGTNVMVQDATADIDMVASTTSFILSGGAGAGTIDQGIWNGDSVLVSYGGTGKKAMVAYAVICGGTTTTGKLQQVSGVGTSGQVLTSAGAGALPAWGSNTTTINGVAINLGASGEVGGDVSRYMPAGRWFGTANINYATTNTVFVQDVIRFVPILIGISGTIATIGININTGGSAGCTFRFGIYAGDATNGYPGTLLYGSGTIAGDVAADKTASPGLAVTPGVYWLAVNNNGTAGITFKSTTSSSGPIIVVGNSSLTAAPLNVFTRAFSYAAMPNPAGAISTSTGAAQIPNIMIQF